MKLTTTIAAALLHDIGHGAFSHALEEILNENGVDFHHETMTVRFVKDENSEINAKLREIDQSLPDLIIPYFKASLRGGKDHWTYKLVSSQMDADRLDYVQRYALFAGIQGSGFDRQRIYDLLYNHGDSIAVDRGALEAIESYLLTIDHLYRTIYYHHAVRAASKMLFGAVSRAVFLYRSGEVSIFGVEGRDHPLARLINEGSAIELYVYKKITDGMIWALLYDWQESKDSILKEISQRILKRSLFKTINIDITDFPGTQRLKERAEEIVEKLYPKTPDASKFCIFYDDPKRTSYKRYDWNPESPSESIWLVGGGRVPSPLEDEQESPVAQSFRSARYFHRLIVPSEVKARLSRS